MPAAPKPQNERERLNALWSYELLDTQPEDAFDAMTKLAANLCGVPIAVVSLVDENRQWFKSQCGLGGVISTGRDASFCAHAILEKNILEVRDATADPRFVDNPLVTGEPRIRFYAGVPLIDSNGMALGTLCVIDRKPRHLSQAQKQQLDVLAQAIIGLIAMRVRRSEIDRQAAAADESNKAHVHLRKRSQHLRAFARSMKSIAPGQVGAK